MGAVKSMFSGPPKPPPPPPVPEAPLPPPVEVDPQVKKARTQERKRASLAAGRDSTILTSPMGLQSLQSKNSFKTLLGA